MLWTKNGLASEGVGPAGRPAQAVHEAQVGSQKSSFSTGFIRCFDMAECHVVYSENLMLFTILRPFCVLGSRIIKIRQVL